MHGGDIYNNRVNLDFSVNINPGGTPEVLKNAMLQAVSNVDRYPDPNYAGLKSVLAEMEGVSPDRIVVGNGASELLTAAANAEAGVSAAVFAPCFTGYFHALQSFDRVKEIYLKEENDFIPGEAETAALTGSGADLLMVGNPNNPTGKIIPEKELLLLLEQSRNNGQLLILDESFLPLCDDSSKKYSLDFDKYPHVIRIRSFTKSLAIPGVRIAYGICGSAALRTEIERRLPEWNVSVIAEAVVLQIQKSEALIGNYMRESLEMIGTEKAFLKAELEKRGIRVFDSDANFLLLKSGQPLYGKLLEKQILIRDCRDYSGLDKGFYRIAVRKREDNLQLLKAIDGTDDACTGSSQNRLEHVLPADIERTSFAIIKKELAERDIVPEGENASVIMRAIHTSADFDYAKTLVFSENAVSIAKKLISEGADIVTDTNMALAGINKKELAKYGGSVHCFMADPRAAELAKEKGTTRAYVSMEMAAALNKKLIFVIGNAPTALVSLHEMMRAGTFMPDFIIGVPVGFVNVEAAKELIIGGPVPYIVNRGRKGGSNISAAIVNALLYQLRGNANG